MFPPNEHWDNANFPGIIYLKNKLKILKLIFDASWCKGSYATKTLGSVFHKQCTKIEPKVIVA